MKTRILKNVLISVGGNFLRLCDVRFSDKIEQVLPHRDSRLDWSEIDTPGKWQKFKTNIEETEFSADEENIDGNFLLLIPGAIDPHVHFDTPGFEFREDFEHGSLAAASGGVTTVIDMPCTSLPPVTSAKNLQTKLEAVKNRSWVDYALWGGVAGNDFTKKKDPAGQIQELAQTRVVGFKAYFTSGMDSFRDLIPEQMERVAQWVKEVNLPLAVHAEDKYLVESRRSRMQKINKNDWSGYCFARDERAEALAIIRLINIARKTGCRIHVVHLSSEFGSELITHAREEGLPVSTETCPHYLHFTNKDFDNPEISAFLKTAPPVKTEYDRQALWKGLENGVISFVTTDHAGCDPEQEKISDNFWEIYGGIPGVEHRVPFLFSEGFKRGRLDLQKTIELLSVNAAKYFGLYPRKGSLETGSDADFALINLWDSFKIDSKEMHSKGKYTPFEGSIFEAKVEQTILRGKIISNSSGSPEVSCGYGQPLLAH